MAKTFTATWEARNQPDEFSGSAPFRGEADFATHEEAKAFIETNAGTIFVATVRTHDIATGQIRDEEFFGKWKTMRDDFTTPVFQL